ncbi:unannotated protein [freshwater metagenome]|uniref:Unannotated protein n=1 Tax=freshwater metagenome TaxID=449393 RepID=A0A6J7BXN3_9ZZZZ
MLDTEPLLLVHDDQAKVLEPDLSTEESVRADDDINRSVRDPGDNLARLLLGLEPRERRHLHRECGIALGERRHVLLNEKCGRYQDRDLLAVLHRLEGSPDGNLRLAVTDVTTDEAIHGNQVLHIGLDLVDTRELIRSFVVGEGVLELALPDGVSAELVALARHACGVQLDQLTRDLTHGLAGARLRLRPVGATESMHTRSLASDIARDLVELVGRDIEAIARLSALGRCVLEHEVFTRGTRDGALHHLDIAPNPVLFVHDEVTGLELQGINRLAPTGRHLAGVSRGRLLADEVSLSEDRES